jgi:uncharacterized membrane protein
MSLSFIYPSYLLLLLLIPLTIWLGLISRRALSRRRLWGGLILRTLLLLSIIFALAGIQLRLRVDTLTTVFVLDFSDSIPQEEQTRGEAFIRQALQAMPAGDRAAVIVFGEDALVDRLASEDGNFPGIASVPLTTRTDIASALQLAQAIFPAEGAKRLVLLSDGRENLGLAVEQANLSASQQIELLFVPVGEPQGDVEVLVDNLLAPSDVRQGESFELVTVIESSAQVNATLRLFIDGVLFQTQEVRLQPGTNRISVTISAEQAAGRPGQGSFRRFQAQIIPDLDTRLQNNLASAFTVVHGPANVLIVEGESGEADNLVSALQAAEMNIRRVSAAEMPTTLTELAAYEAVILVNVNAPDLPDGAMQALPVYVRDLGFGLLMIGGETSFGAGGYLRTPLEAALPVDMDVRDREIQANLALILAVDKSGSMGRCHCDNPDLNQTYTRQEVGLPKVDIAKEAIMRAAGALGEQDFLGVVTFDTAAKWSVRLAPLIDPFTLESAIGTFQAEGGTNLEAGVQAAYQALLNVDARRKHVILLTDGWVRQGDLTRLALEMAEQGITLSVVAAGEGSAEYLAALAQMGGGRFYPATNILNVPDIFLKETVASVGQYIIEEPFFPLPSAPGPVLSGLDVTRLPGLLGYNGATAKNTARMDLLTARGDPLLATWQYGLGRSAAWTSDMKGQWARQWLTWEGFPRFAAQLVSWLLPTPKTEGLEASASIENGQAILRLQAVDRQGQPLNFLDAQATIIDPDLNATVVNLRQTAPGAYSASLNTPNPGVYLARLGVNDGDQSLGQLTLGVVMPYSPEYKASGMDLGLLNELARITGGGQLTDPLQTFVHNLPAVDTAREIWRPFLLLAALLFPLDVALRRVMLSRSDFEKLRQWVSARLPFVKQGTAASGEGRLLGRLFQARQRARRRSEGRIDETKGDQESRPPLGTLSAPPPPTISTSGEPAEKPVDQAASQKPTTKPASQEDSLARLREAKKRARKE